MSFMLTELSIKVVLICISVQVRLRADKSSSRAEDSRMMKESALHPTSA